VAGARRRVAEHFSDHVPLEGLSREEADALVILRGQLAEVR
jgi:hypothetical protein